MTVPCISETKFTDVIFRLAVMFSISTAITGLIVTRAVSVIAELLVLIPSSVS